MFQSLSSRYAYTVRRPRNDLFTPTLCHGGGGVRPLVPAMAIPRKACVLRRSSGEPTSYIHVCGDSGDNVRTTRRMRLFRRQRPGNPTMNDPGRMRGSSAPMMMTMAIPNNDDDAHCLIFSWHCPRHAAAYAAAHVAACHTLVDFFRCSTRDMPRHVP